MRNFRLGIIQHLEPGVLNLPAPVQIFAIHEIILIEQPHLIHSLSPNHQERPGHRIYFNFLVNRRVDIIVAEASQPKMPMSLSASMRFTHKSSVLGRTSVSEFNSKTYRPLDCPMAALLPLENPTFLPFSVSLACGNWDFTISWLPSAEPLSATRTSNLKSVCDAKTDAKQRRRMSRVL